jgi:hypothetical protein
MILVKQTNMLGVSIFVLLVEKSYKSKENSFHIYKKSSFLLRIYDPMHCCIFALQNIIHEIP